MRLISGLLIILALAACGPAPHAVEISKAWARPTPGGVDVAAGYLTITNHANTDETLVSAASPRGRVQIHTMDMTGGMMSMRPSDGLPIKAGGALTLAPGGAHLMFDGLASPFTPGEQVPVTLTFAHAGAIEVTLSVQQNPPS